MTGCNNIEWYRKLQSNSVIGIVEFFRWSFNGAGDGGKTLLIFFSNIFGPTLKFIGTLITALANERNFMPFIAFVICIGIVIAVFFGLMNSKKKKKSRSVTAPSTSIFNMGTFDMSDLYRTLTPRINMATVFGGQTAARSTVDRTLTDRKKINGRCDNLHNYTISNTGLCNHTSTPEPIVWTLDIEKMPELNELSERVKTDFVDGAAQKYIVTIPWGTYENDGLHYYPDCRRATFESGESASYLFTDNGKNSCEKRIVRRTINGERQRPTLMNVDNKYNGLQGYL